MLFCFKKSMVKEKLEKGLWTKDMLYLKIMYATSLGNFTYKVDTNIHTCGGTYTEEVRLHY